MAWRACGRPPRRSCACGPSRIDDPSNFVRNNPKETGMTLKSIAATAALAAATFGALFGPSLAQAQAKEQFFPLLVYRTGPYAPNGTPWANGKQDYIKYINATGGINGVKISFEECETGYATDKGVEC